MIESAVINDRTPLIHALFEQNPAILGASPPPASSAIGFALEYGKTRLLPLLARVWPVPDDLPHAAGTGDSIVSGAGSMPTESRASAT